MKKFLSLMLTLALIITTLALPITASADEGDETATSSITVTYDAKFNGKAISNDNKVKPGDTFTVDVKITATGDAATEIMTQADISLLYDSNLFTPTVQDLDSNTGKVGNWTVANVNNYDGTYVQFTQVDTELVLNTELTVATIDFKVNDISVSAETKMLTSFSNTGFMDENGNEYRTRNNNLTLSETTIYVEANSVTPYITVGETKAALISGNTYYSEDPITLSYEGTNVKVATYKKTEDTEVTSFLETKSASISVAGEYTVSLQVAGAKQPTEYKFTYVAQNVDVKLAASTENVAVHPGEAINVSVKISGIPENKQASMVSFDVESNRTDVTYTNISEGATYTNGSVVYGNEKNSTGLSNDDTVATLTYTASTDAKYGDVTFTFKKAQLALTTTYVNPNADNIGFTADSITSTVIPTGDFATISGGADNWNGNNNQPYDLTVTPEANTVEGTTTEVKYRKVNASTTLEENAKAIFDSSDAVGLGEDKKINVNSEETIYVVAKIGSQYHIVKKLVNGVDIFFDNTKPTLNGTANMTEWVSTVGNAYEHNISTITATDSTSGINRKYYKVTGIEEENAISDDKITFEANKSVVTSDDLRYTVYAVDNAGNVSETGVDMTLKIDGDAPVITLGGTDSRGYADETEGKIELLFTAGDATSTPSTKVTYGDNFEKTLEPTVDEDNKTKHWYATQSGTYKITVTDEANNSTEKTVTVELSNISKAAELKVNVVKDGTAYTNKIFADGASEITAFGNTNGKFTYLHATPENVPGATSTLALYKKANDQYSDTAVNANDEDKTNVTVEEVGEYKLVVTTTNTANPTQAPTATYYFEIVAAENMPSVDEDKYYNIFDYGRIRNVIGKTTNSSALPTADNAAKFSGGIFSGDVNGDFTMNENDLYLIIEALRNGERPGTYTFPIMNLPKASTGE